MLGKLALQFAFVAQFEVLEAEGGGYSATYQAETSFRWDVGSKPLAGLYYHLHLVVGEQVMHGQTAVRINNINVESFTGMVVPNLRHIVQAVEGREVAARQHIIYGGDGLVAAVVVAIYLPEVPAFGVRFQVKCLNVFLCVHIRHQILSANIRAIFVLEVQRKASRSSFAVHSRSSSSFGLEMWNTSKERISATTLCATLLRPSYVIVIVAVILFPLFFQLAKLHKILELHTAE